MTGGEAIIALSAGLGIFAVSTAGLTFAAPGLIRAIRRVQPALRASFVLTLAAAPYVLGAFVALGVVFFPHAVALELTPVHRHDSLSGWAGHGAFTGPGISAWTMVLIAVLLLLRIGQASIAAIVETQRLKRTLERVSIRRDNVVRRIASDQPLALAVGVLRPAIYLSDAVAVRAGAEGSAIIEAHERAHLARGDLAARFVLEVLCSLFPDTAKAHLRQALVLAQEQACDRAVALHHEPIRIAETLVRMERVHANACALSAQFQDADITLRVRALLEPDFEAPARSIARASASGGVLLVAAFLALEPLHHKIESLFLTLGG